MTLSPVAKSLLILAAIAAFTVGFAIGVSGDDRTAPMTVLGMRDAPRCSSWTASPRHKDGWAYGITASHCWDGGGLLRLSDFGRPLSYAAIVLVAQVGDMTVFRFKQGEEDQSYYRIQKDLPAWGESITAIGYAVHFNKGVRQVKAFFLPGTYIGQSFVEKQHEYTTTVLPVQKGMSGGPVFGQKGVFAIVGMRFIGGLTGVADVRGAPVIMKAERQCRLNKERWDSMKAVCNG